MWIERGMYGVQRLEKRLREVENELATSMTLLATLSQQISHQNGGTAGGAHGDTSETGARAASGRIRQVDSEAGPEGAAQGGGERRRANVLDGTFAPASVSAPLAVRSQSISAGSSVQGSEGVGRIGSSRGDATSQGLAGVSHRQGSGSGEETGNAAKALSLGTRALSLAAAPPLLASRPLRQQRRATDPSADSAQATSRDSRTTAFF